MILKKIKINYTKGILKQIRLFDIPLFQYEKTHEGKLKSVTFPLFRKPKTDKPTFYLKVNSCNWKYAIPCIQHWLDIVTFYDSDFYIICDNKKIEYKILSEITFETSNIKFIKSNRTYFKKYIKNICSSRWVNAGFSHLTTYIHAKKNGINEFWNIDADDTMFFAPPELIANCLKQIEKYAQDKKYCDFSLDMHRSSFGGLYWTFGVTYSSLKHNNIEEYIKNLKDNSWMFKYFKDILNADFPDANLDTFYTYLKFQNKINVGSFNIKNLYFMHWGICDFMELIKSLQIVRDDTMYFPIASTINNKYQNINVFEDVINFDFDLEENISASFLHQKLFSYIEWLKLLQDRYNNSTEIKTLYPKTNIIEENNISI